MHVDPSSTVAKEEPASKKRKKKKLRGDSTDSATQIVDSQEPPSLEVEPEQPALESQKPHLKVLPGKDLKKGSKRRDELRIGKGKPGMGGAEIGAALQGGFLGSLGEADGSLAPAWD